MPCRSFFGCHSSVRRTSVEDTKDLIWNFSHRLLSHFTCYQRSWAPHCHLENWRNSNILTWNVEKKDGWDSEIKMGILRLSDEEFLRLYDYFLVLFRGSGAFLGHENFRFLLSLSKYLTLSGSFLWTSKHRFLLFASSSLGDLLEFSFAYVSH